MREISSKEITDKVKSLCMNAACNLTEDVEGSLRDALKKEASPLGREVLGQIVENFEIARNEGLPMCQDTGIAVFFVEVGWDVHVDGSLEDAVNEGVRQGYGEGYLRKSVCHALKRKNTGDNTPSIIHTEIVEGEKIRIRFAAKGAGSENMSALKMLKPAEGVEGVKKFVVDTVRGAGGNPCPPIVVGVGIGGSFEKSAILSKKALLRPVGEKNPDPEVSAIEEDILQKVNRLGIGPMGFGGTVTALAVHVEVFPCHIASLPVAVNIQCHADRHREVII
ncbi:MAG: fumarate hydratase [Deltaproteobacteria bacterium]|mgnify:CR=1 FL=1